jgi:hypothetical protein
MTLNLKCPCCGYTETVHDERSAWVIGGCRRPYRDPRTIPLLPTNSATEPAL